MRPVAINHDSLPAALRRALNGAPLFREETGRSRAEVLYCPARGGLYLKIDQPGALKNAALMQDFLAAKGLAAPLEAYESAQRDYLLIRRVAGENGISAHHLSDPARLAASLGEAARRLHETPADGCPVRGLTEGWLAGARRAAAGQPRLTRYLSDYLGVYTAQNALREMEALSSAGALDSQTLVHGDLCLPNFMLDDFRFTGFIDLGEGGLGDRHYDLFWTLWSLSYNCGDDRFRGRFLDAYGRDAVNEDKIRFCGLMNCLEGD